MCVEYMVANLILLCSLKISLLIETWKTFAREYGLSFFHFFLFFFLLLFYGRHLSTHCFRYLGHLSIFSILFLEELLHSPCLFYCNWNFSRETFTRTWSIYPNNHIFVYIPNIWVEHFWVDGKHVFAYSQCRSSTYMCSVRDLDLESMISFSTRVTRFDQTQHNDK